MPVRFYSLDVLRGIAALCVVIWHWQLFFYDGSVPSPMFAREDMPLFTIAALFYKKGYLAVDLFFCLSGFIFHWLYAKEISTRNMPGREFFVLRFSRLYPLHLVTLLTVAALQAAFFGLTGDYFGHSHNTVRNFALHLIFANVISVHSFNGPAWSISVEVLLYAIFFVLYRLLPVRMPVTILMVMMGVSLYSPFGALGRGLIGFFMGGGAFLLYQTLLARGLLERVSVPLAVVVFLQWLGSVIYVQSGATDTGASMWSMFVLFPSTIFCLATLETRQGTLGKRLAILGDISYSSYLWHFPLQLVAMLVVVRFGIDRDIFYSPVTVVAFFVLLVGLSLLSYHVLERPAQSYIRKRFTRRERASLVGSPESRRAATR